MVVTDKRTVVARSEQQRLKEENRRLQAENRSLHEQAGYLFSLQGMTMVMAAELDPGRLADLIIRSATTLIGGSSASLLLVDPTTQDLVREAASGDLPGEWRGWRLPRGQGLAGWVSAHSRAVVVNDVAADPRWAMESEGIADRQPGAIVAAPLIARGKTVGVLEVFAASDHQFGRQEQKWLAALAEPAALALDNVRVFRGLTEERNRLLHLQEETRKRLARDLHDGPAQVLSAFAMNVDFVRKLLDREPDRVAPELENLKLLAQKASRELRTFLFELRPLILESQGLLPTLQSYLGRIQTPQGPEFKLRLRGELGSVPQATEIAAFIIVQEALGNVKKHARARHCYLDVSRRGDFLQVVIRDNGTGFDLPAVQRDYDQRGSLGLVTMRERAELLGGSLSIKSVPGRGTSVALKIPV